jgi:hypothetical protein
MKWLAINLVDGNTELFSQFAYKRRPLGFTGINLAPRKLPTSGHGFSGWASRQEHCTGRVRQKACDY